MAYEHRHPRRKRDYDTIHVGDQEFMLVPTSDGGQIPGSSQGPHTELLRFDHPSFKGYLPYTYEKLLGDKKKIRLLKLYPGATWGHHIYCELVEVEYDDKFHIPCRIDAAQSSTKSQTAKKAGQHKWKDIDLRTRGEENEETEAEEQARLKRQELRNLKRLVDELKAKEDPQQEQKKESEKTEELIRQWQEARKKEVHYEALSWTWGNDNEDYVILIKRNEVTYKKRVRKELALALKYLRRPGKERRLWIDAVCIDQENDEERNQQVQMMSRVYTRAQQVCIWLGEADRDSEIAINFIKDEMKELKNFDRISSDEQYSQQWRALMSLMQRPWFFRRWVVQEIALARAATVYCGSHRVPWKSFAVAVELFVEVETATHRLSDVMKPSEKFRHVPGWFEYVSELGASLLVQATGRVFRTKDSPMQRDPDSSGDESDDRAIDRFGQKYKRDVQEERRKREAEEERRIHERIRQTWTIDPLERRSLLSLEYLVSTMFIFTASEPRDVVYALLAIARDASPFAVAQRGKQDRNHFLIMTILDQILAEKPFVVDYSRPYSDVCRDFVEFSIMRGHKNDPTQALDILCRPWALEAPKGKSTRLKNYKKDKEDLIPRRSEWERRKTTVEMGNWDEDGRKFTRRHIKNKGLGWIPDPRDNKEYWKETELKTEWTDPCAKAWCSHDDNPNCEGKWTPNAHWKALRERYFPPRTDSDNPPEDMELPSWIARAAYAPFMLDHAPGMKDVQKTSRANADPLVGSPQDGHRNYNAAGSEKLDKKKLKFKKRPLLNHYSLYVQGFELDEIVKVKPASQRGGIPLSWLKLGGYEDITKDPPDEFWRTIVADRGRDNKNPPYYYARACKESIHKGGHKGGSVDTTGLINDEQNSIVAEFCRRVHAVIWNRCLFRTARGRLGLGRGDAKPGDKVFILYGCTVPVILAEHSKNPADNEKDSALTLKDILLQETEADCIESLKKCIKKAVINRERKATYKPKKATYKDEDWEEMMDARQSYLNERRREKKEGKQTAENDRKEKKFKRDRKEFMKELASRMISTEKDKEKAEKGLETAKSDLEIAKKALKDYDRGRQRTLSPVNREQFQNMDEADQDDERRVQSRNAELEKENSEEAIIAAQAAIDAAEAEMEEINLAAQDLDKILDPKPVTEENSGLSVLAAKSRTKTWSSFATGGIELDDTQPQGSEDGNPENGKDAGKNFWYKFKGECYLHGMMDGEAMKEKFYNGGKDLTVELR